ncbi:SusC/RagA family TonB-linked outer membrane protein [Alphaproteobacteria bacterium]|nr:SusC/RagA family TonB-linked outer membrane protein [Alphaproteobacteria bacterium]
MNKLSYLLFCLFLGIGLVSAQTTRVTGIVISADDGEPIIGASVMVKGTSIGTVTDINGAFSLNVPSDAKTLSISYVGMVTQESAVKPTLNIRLLSDTQHLDEVVVTALGISRSEKALGFAATTVDNERLTQGRSSDIMSSIAGKVAGVQITSTSSDPGASSSVIIRGISSLSGSNQPLYIVDGAPLSNRAVFTNDGLNQGYDFGNGSNAVNPDDVATMTILKGAAATALYGSRASNGVIVITTKSGQKQGAKRIGIEYNGGIQAETILRLPDMQNDFGIGWSGDYTMIENGSWGPRFDGSLQLWGRVYNNSQKLKPYLPLKNNIKDFFDTGVRYSNSISFNNATETNNYYVSFSQISDDGIIPTNADTYNRYTFSARGGQKIGNLNVTSSVNFSNSANKFVTTGQGINMLNSLYQTPRDISIIGLKDLDDPFNQPGYYYTPYGVTNPYYILANYLNTYKAEKIFGKFDAEYSFLKYFKAIYRIGLDATNSQHKLGQPNLEALSAGTPNGNDLAGSEGMVRVNMERNREINQDAILSFDMPISDFAINALTGFNYNERKRYYSESEITGLDIPTWYNLSNSASTPQIEEYEQRRRMMGLFGQAELSWKSMAYLTLTARNDWSSTLPKGNNSFFYPGITGSFIFTELLSDELKNTLSFGKIRLAYGQTGNDASPYMIDPYYEKAFFNSTGWGEVNFPIGGSNAFMLGNVLGNVNLSPEITTEYEAGLNLTFFKGRIAIDAAYYDRNSDKQIFSLNMDPSTGYTKQNINLGKINNKGIELLVNLRPIEIKDFSWDVAWTFTKNNSKVISLPEELGGIANLSPLSGSTAMYAIVGKPIGTFKAEVPLYDPQGHIVVNPSTGLPVPNPEDQIIGDINYDYEMGISTSFKYRGIVLSGDLDIRQGGIMFSRTKDINYFVGNPIQTLYNDRHTFIIPNSVNNIGTAEAPVYVENTTPVASDQVYQYWGDGGTDMGSFVLVDKSFIRLRTISLGYDLPRSLLKNTFLENVRLSVFGNNLFIWTPKSNNLIDPEGTSFGNDLRGKYGEYITNPSTRKFGFNLMVKF